MMNVSYLFRSGEDANLAKPGDWLLEIRIISDSGFDDENASSNADPADFAGIEATESTLVLNAFFCTAEFKGNWLKHVWNALEWPKPDGEVRRESDLPITTLATSLNLADLPNKEAVQSSARAFKKQVSEAFTVDAI